MQDNSQQNQATVSPDDQAPQQGQSKAVAKPKKEKTSEQRERERARRKRRREKEKAKKLVGSEVSSESISAAVSEEAQQPVIVTGESQPEVPAVVPDEEGFGVAPIELEPIQPYSSEPTQAESNLTEPTPQFGHEIRPGEDVPFIAVPEAENLEDDWLKNAPPIFPEEEIQEGKPEQVPAAGKKEEIEVHEAVPLPEESEELSPEQAAEAEQLRKEISSGLEELPAKQGIFGHLFDLIQVLVSRRAESGQRGGAILRIIKSLIRIIITIAVIVALIFGAFWAGSSLKFFGNVPDIFKNIEWPFGAKETKVTPKEIVIDQNLLRAWGIKTAQIAGQNKGSIHEQIAPVFFTSYYFGKLKEPVFYRETGMTAAFYFGLGRDITAGKSRFENYVITLQELRSAIEVNLDQYLNKSIDRDLALRQFLNDSTAIFDLGNKKRKEMKMLIDDLKISLASLQTDKDRYEADFFAKIEKGESELSSQLLDNFIVVSQKEVELKAKLAALVQLETDYENVLIQIKIRNEAITKNYDALVKGVKVYDVPGAEVLIKQ